jgi:hypothetical protein
MSLLSRSAVEYKLRHWESDPGNPHVVSGSGELDLQAAPELRELLCRLIDPGDEGLRRRPHAGDGLDRHFEIHSTLPEAFARGGSR